MTTIEVTLLVGILSPVFSAGTALAVLLAAPRLNFGVWKKQKLREQQLAVAERFAAISKNFYLHTNLPLIPHDLHDTAKTTELFAPALEQQAVVTIIGVLFQHLRTQTLLRELWELINEEDRTEDCVRQMSALRGRILTMMFAEALELPMRPFSDDLPARAKTI